MTDLNSTHNSSTHMLNIKFLGVGEQVRIIENRFNEVRKSTSLPIRMEIVNQHNRILEHDISGIPSLMINNHLLIEGRMPSTNELKNTITEFHNFHKSTLNMNTNIKKILVPIDNSSTAMAALEYAKAFSKINHASIDMLHVCSYRFDHINNGIPESLEDLKNQKTEPIRKMVSNLIDDDSMNILCEVGYPIDVISANSKDYDLIIMGSTGKHGFVDKLLGSISSGVAQHAHCPVLLVPPGKSHVNFSKTLCACQPQNINADLLESIFGLSPHKDFEEIHFVEIIKPNQEDDAKSNQEILEEIQEGGKHDIHFFIDHIKGDSIVDALNDYASKNDIGVIVMTTKHRTPLKALFHKSATKQMVLDIKVPLLVLHVDD